MKKPIMLAALTGVGAVAGLAGAGLAVAAPPAATDGQAIFVQNCAACHQTTGKGIPGAFPALDGDAFVKGPEPSVATLILKGRGGMPSFSSDLSDQQIAAVLTYVRSAWSNKAPPIVPATVAAARKGAAAEEHSALPFH